jgi:hypothetical protein
MLNADKRTVHDVMRAQLALALVSRRAHECRNGSCGRKRQCLARLRPPDFKIHEPLGDCPNMSGAEWRIVSLGMQRVYKRFERFYPERDRAIMAAIDTFPKKERDALKAHLKRIWAKQGAEEAKERHRGVSYFEWLWTEEVGLSLESPKDVGKAYAGAIAYWAERGKKSAEEAGDWGLGIRDWG